jgi:hypothetical protein
VNDTPAERGGDSTWARLRRRKVVQWARQIRQCATLVALIGLPVVLVIGWYHGDRGQQRISTPELATLTLLLLLGGGALWHYQRTSETATVSSPPPPSAPAFATDASMN